MNLTGLLKASALLFVFFAIGINLVDAAALFKTMASSIMAQKNGNGATQSHPKVIPIVQAFRQAPPKVPSQVPPQAPSQAPPPQHSALSEIKAATNKHGTLALEQHRLAQKQQIKKPVLLK